MKYLTLELAKKHLNIDNYFTDDDNLIETYCLAAEKAIENRVDIDLDELCEDGELPETLKISMLLLVGNLYMCRESISTTSFVRIPDTIELLLNPYINYNTNTCECC